MIKRARGAEGVRITFTLDTSAAVSVVGDFNEWDPAAHPLKPRTNGKRSVSVLMHPGRPVTFRYLAEIGGEDRREDRARPPGAGHADAQARRQEGGTRRQAAGQEGRHDQGEGQAQALGHHPRCSWAIQASMASACFGSASDSTRQPSTVTSTSSSMRTPMPRSSSGTVRSSVWK